MERNTGSVYDLESRLLEFAALVIRFTDVDTKHFASKHIANQLIRAGTAPLSNHGEAQAAESNKDFVHKMSIALKELRECERWLKLLKRADLRFDSEQLANLLAESDELIRIFVTSIKTAKSKSER